MYNKLKLRKFQEGVGSMPAPEMMEEESPEQESEGVDIKAVVEEYLMQPSFEAQQQIIGMIAEMIMPQKEPMQNESGLPQFKKGGSMKKPKPKFGKTKMMKKGGGVNTAGKFTPENKAYQDVIKNGYLNK